MISFKENFELERNKLKLKKYFINLLKNRQKMSQQLLMFLLRIISNQF